MQEQLFFSEFSVRTMNPGGAQPQGRLRKKGMAFDPYVPRGAAYQLPLFAYATRISGVRLRDKDLGGWASRRH
jgi:hypothetical protein